MGILKSLGAYLGGLITVLAIISFIFVFSVNVSQASLSNAFNHITINSTGLGSLNSTSGAQTVCSLLASGSVNATNSTCSIFSILSGFVSSVPGGSIYSSFFTPSSFYSYSILLLVLAVIGSLMVFFSAFSWKGISAVGKNVLSSAAVSFFVTFIPVMFFLPIILSFH